MACHGCIFKDKKVEFFFWKKLTVYSLKITLSGIAVLHWKMSISPIIQWVPKFPSNQLWGPLYCTTYSNFIEIHTYIKLNLNFSEWKIYSCSYCTYVSSRHLNYFAIIDDEEIVKSRFFAYMQYKQHLLFFYPLPIPKSRNPD